MAQRCWGRVSQVLLKLLFVLDQGQATGHGGLKGSSSTPNQADQMALPADAASPVSSARLAAIGGGVMPTGAGALQTEASLESHQRMVADKLSVSELMTTQLVALEPVMRVRPALNPNPYHPVPDLLLLSWTLQCASLCHALSTL